MDDEPAALGYSVREPLARDEYWVLFRAVRDGDAHKVLLKRPRVLPPSPLLLAALRRELDVLGEIEGEGIPRALGLEPPVLVLEDHGGVPLGRLLGTGPLDIERFLAVATGLARAVEALHDHGFVHRALCTDQVGVQPDSLRVELFDFSAASRIAELENPPLLGTFGAPRLLSPEQTGRMNRVVDYRCDFYALGAIFYELLTGRPAFAAKDALELVHLHVAHTPASPSALRPNCPALLSKLVMKLLAKMAEDRYQSAAGLLADLEEFQRGFRLDGAPPLFALGANESSERLTVPQKLYGREREAAVLLEAYETAATGVAVFAFVGGHGGVGKTSVVGEIEKPIAARGGRFLRGKFDEIERSVPYLALIQALSGLCRQIAQECAERRDSLATRLRNALGKNAGVLTAVIPELEALLMPSESVPALGPAQTRDRFIFALHSLLAALARPGEPLVIFLDDLQWADLATLRVLSGTLATAGELPLLLIGAFRDNEVTADHPLSHFRTELSERGIACRDVPLAPLRLPHVEAFLRDALGSVGNEPTALAELVLQKTGGNPFFVIQFLKSLHQQGLIGFDRSLRRWSFDLDRVKAAGITDNVLELMTAKLRHLPPATREVVEVASCLGSPFALETLAMLRAEDRRQAAAELWEAIAEGLIVPKNPNFELLLAGEETTLGPIEFGFLHDRVKQATYASIPHERRMGLHLSIGRALWAQGDAPERLFEIAGHMNLARELIVDRDERMRLAELDLAAGRRARARAAVQPALELFSIGQSLLEPSTAQASELFVNFSVEAAECEFICGEAERAEARLDAVISGSASEALKSEAFRIRIIHYENAGRFAEAVSVGGEALAALGVAIGESQIEREEALRHDLSGIEAARAGRDLAALMELPRMADTRARLVARLIVALWPSAFLSNQPGLTAVLSARLVRLSLELGNTEESALGYITHAITMNERSGSYLEGRDFGRLGLAVSDRFADPALRVKVRHLFGSFLAGLYEPLAECRAHAQEAHRGALEIGDFTYAARAAFMETWYAFFSGEPLSSFERHALSVVELVRRVHHDAIERAQRVLLQWARCLAGRTHAETSLSDDTFDEAACEASFADVPVFLGFLLTARAWIAHSFERYEDAFELSGRAAVALAGSAKTLWHAELDFVRGLALAALMRDASDARRAELDTELSKLLEAVLARRQACAVNFAYQAALLAAERARALSLDDAAEQAYAEAVAAAEQSGFLHARALAHELRASFLASRGEVELSRSELLAAVSGYENWGAMRKARVLMGRHGAPLGEQRGIAMTSDFDAASALKAAQAIAVEIERERLLPRLIQIAIENAGAERGVLLEANDGALLAVAEGAVASEVRVHAPEPLEMQSDLPHALIRRVYACGEPLVLDDARRDPRFRDDPYFRDKAPRAVLCAPVVRQGATSGVLYLENRQSSDVFGGRVDVVLVLASQAAISLENARLYQSVQAEVERRAEVEEALKRALGDLESLKNRLLAENVYLREEIRTQHNFDEIIGNGAALLEALHRVEKVAGVDTAVLVTGETGTGKELFARAIHSRSTRSERPLVKVNCAAIASGLVESELFGHVKGAFTGALHRRVGRFELAHCGTIFLDEVGELPLETQVKLLRVLQEQEFEPVGSSKTEHVDVRVIAATNRDLNEAVAEGRFRADLLYRLNVFPIRVPPLRQRREDIPLLVSFFLMRAEKRLGKTLHGFARADMERLVSYAWPGNVRELENVVERAAILAQGSVPTLDPRLFGPGYDGEGASAPVSAKVPAPAPAPIPRPFTLRELEREHILAVLESTSWVIEGPHGAARALGLHPNTLRSRMKKLGMVRERGQRAR